MQKTAFRFGPHFGRGLVTKGLAGLGLGGAGLAAYKIGKRSGGSEAMEEVVDIAQDVANDAFMEGVEYALTGGGGAEKQSFYAEFAKRGLEQELEKLGFSPANLAEGALNFAKGVGGKVKQLYGAGSKRWGSAGPDIKTQTTKAFRRMGIVGGLGVTALSAIKKGLGRTKTSPQDIADRILKAYKGSAAGVSDLVRNPTIKNLRRGALALGTGIGVAGAGGYTAGKLLSGPEKRSAYQNAAKALLEKYAPGTSRM